MKIKLLNNFLFLDKVNLLNNFLYLDKSELNKQND